MEGPSHKRRKIEVSVIKDAPHSVDPSPQDDHEPQPLAQPPPEPHPEAGTPQAEQVLHTFRQHFIEDINADSVVMDLKYYNIIADGEQKRITQTEDARQKNEFLHDFLLKNCTDEALLKVCNVIIHVQGYPRMNTLGKMMKIALLGQTKDDLSQEMEVCPDLMKLLQCARRWIYSRYKRLTLIKGQRTLQFTKVAVLQNAPKPRSKRDPDQGEFLKRYRDCGVRLSEGAEQVTVNHFLRKGPHQTRIIYGQPGTGKTTFLKHLCQKVASDEPSDFSLVLFFPLRDKAVSESLRSKTTPYNVGLESLLQYCITDGICSDVTQELLQCQGKNVLIIFDGADEVRGLMNSPDGSLLDALLEGRLLPQAHFIVSTRPGGCPLLQEHSSLFYEILGFDKKAVESYIKDYFKSEPGKEKAMLSDLMARPDLMGGAYIPINLQIFCSIYEHGVAGRLAFPATMTECYNVSTARSVTREKQKVKNTYRVDPTLTDLPPDVKQLLSSLGDLAFNGLTQEPPHYIFQEGEVRDAFHATVKCNETLDDSIFAGLLHLHPDQDGFSSTLNFSHTTKQEYFAAYHLSLLPEAEQAAFWRKNRHNPKFAVVLKFAAGLTKIESSVVREAILPKGGGLPSKCDTANPYLLYVLHALFESQNESLTQNIASQLNSCLMFDLYLTPFDTMVLCHCLTKCKHLTELHTSLIGSLFPTSFHHVCSVVQSNPHLESLTLHVDQFSTEDARVLCQAAGSLRTLNLIVRWSCTLEALAEVFDHRPLEELDLFLNIAGELVGDSTVLKEKVAHCPLKRLELYGDSTPLLPVLSGSKDNSSITNLDVADTSLNSSDQVASAVAMCGQYMPQLRTFSIFSVNPLPLFWALGDRECHLNHVKVEAPNWEFSKEDFGEEEWAQLEGTASRAKVLKVAVDVDRSDRGARALAAGFVKNEVVREVKLRRVPEKLVESVRGTLSRNTALNVDVKSTYW